MRVVFLSLLGVWVCCLGSACSTVVSYGAPMTCEDVRAALRDTVPSTKALVTGNQEDGFRISIVSLAHSVTIERLASLGITLRSVTLAGDLTMNPVDFDLSLLQNMPLDTLEVTHCNVSHLESLPTESLRMLRFAGVPQVTDVDFLEGAESLEYLDVTDTSVRDLTPLRKIRRLKRLFLNGTHVADLSPLRGLQLEELRIAGTSISNVSPLARMPLQDFYCRDTRLSSVDALASTPLRRLSVGWTSVTNLSAIRNLKLEMLDIEGCCVPDLDPLKKMPLNSLFMDPHYVTNGIATVREMSTLEYLDCRVSDLGRLPYTPAVFWHKYDDGLLECHPREGVAFSYRRRKPMEEKENGVFFRVGERPLRPLGSEYQEEVNDKF